MNLFYKMLAERHETKSPRIIAELKKSEPEKDLAYDYKRLGAAAVSIVADVAPLIDTITAATGALNTGFTILYKTMFEEYERALACALEWEERSAVLLVVKRLKKQKIFRLIDRLEKKGIEPVLEVNDHIEADFALGCGVKVVCVNSRSLETLQIDLNAAGVLTQYIEQRAPHVKIIFASGIEHISFLALSTTRSLFRLNKTYIDVSPDAFLVGRALNEHADVDAAWKSLVG